MARYSHRHALRTLLSCWLVSVSCQGTAGILHVDPNRQATTASGAQQAEITYETLGEAARALRPGDELVIKGGIYRESLRLPEHNWLADRPTIIRSFRGDSVLIKGSDIVTGWQSLGGGLFVKTGWTTNTQQVFLDGSPLEQTGGSVFGGYPDRPDHPLARLHPGKGIWPGRKAGKPDQLPGNSFFYDTDRKLLFIKLPKNTFLSGHTVEASVRSRLLEGRNLENVVIRDLSFQHSNSSGSGRGGAVHLLGNSILVENIEVTLADSIGLVIRGHHNRVSNSSFNSCGQIGMVASGRHVEITNTETSNNNTRSFNKNWAAGGAKFGGGNGLHDSVILNHRSFSNMGDGIWVDWKNTNISIQNSITAYNTGHGIHYEASATGHIGNNYSYANRQRGIYLPHSSQSTISNNLVAFNNLEGIAIIDAGRNDPDGEFNLRPANNEVTGNILAWNNRKSATLVLPQDLLGNRSDYNLYITEAAPVFSLGWPSRSFMTKGVGLPAWRRISGQDVHSWSIETAPDHNLLNAIENKVLEPDWTTLLTMANEYIVRDKTSASGKKTRPGPDGP